MNEAIAKPSLADQAAFVDAVAIASRILSSGARGAIGASTVEIVALAQRLLALQTLADLTFDMLATADQFETVTDLDARTALRREVAQKIAVLGASLEALGFGETQSETTNQEKNDGTDR
jgi:hypothetical protein